MIALISSMIALLAVIVLIYSHCNINFNIKLSFIIALISIALIILGIFFLVKQIDILTQAYEKRSWPTTIGEIVKTEVAGERALHPQISYKYRIEDKTYTASTDLHISGFGNKRSRMDNSKKIINEFPVGTQVRVYYDSHNPKISYLRIGPFWSDYIKLATGLLLFASGSFILLGGLFNKIKYERNND